MSEERPPPGADVNPGPMEVEEGTLMPPPLPPPSPPLTSPPNTTKECLSSNAKERANSTGLTSLVGNITLGINADGNAGTSSDDESVFTTVDAGKQKDGAGVPTDTPEKFQARTHSQPPGSGKNTVPRTRSDSVSSGAGTIVGAGAGTGSGLSSPAHDFPQAYYNVRKQRANATPYVELPLVDGNRRKSAQCCRLQPGFDIAGDDRQHSVTNFHIPSLKKNVSASVTRDKDDLHCVSCNSSHSFSGTEPVVVILTDQNFSPSLPAQNTQCCVILRLEDCLLSELPGVLKEFFGSRTRYLPEGSLLVFGSLSHLVARGPENYAEEAVKMAKVFTNMLHVSCSVTHNIFLPLGGVASPGIIRDMYDVDSWLRAGTVSSSLSLPKTRAAVWQTLCEENGDSVTRSHAERTLYLPESLRESKKIRTVAAEIPNLPEQFKPISPEGEAKIIHCLMHEIADIYAIKV
jgi:hypothetical protein